MTTRRVAPACLLALALIPAQVSADPIPVTSGFFASTGQFTSTLLFELEAPDFRAAGNLGGGEIGPDNTCAPCAPGDVISLSSTFLASLGFGTATVDGTEHPPIGFAAYDVLLNAPDIVTPGVAGAFTVTRPFTFSGRFTGIVPFDETFTPLFERLLVGQGLATASFIENVNPAGTPLFSLGSVRYDFASPAPVPEPATLLLVATGLGAALRLHKRARRRDSALRT